MFGKYEESAAIDQDVFQDWADGAIEKADAASRLIKRTRDEAAKNPTFRSQIESGKLPSLQLEVSEIMMILGEPEV